MDRRHERALALGTYTYIVTAIDVANHATSSAPLIRHRHPRRASPRLARSRPSRRRTRFRTCLAAAGHVRRDWLAGLPRRRAGDARSLTAAAMQLRRRRPCPAQGPHSYVVQAMSGASLGRRVQPRSPSSTTRCRRRSRRRAATANPDGSISLDWPAGRRIRRRDPVSSSYVVRRGGQTSPPDMSIGRNGRLHRARLRDTAASTGPPSSGSIYGYSVFAIDGAGQLRPQQSVSARAFDSRGARPRHGLQGLASARPMSTSSGMRPPAQGNNADLAGYRADASSARASDVRPIRRTARGLSGPRLPRHRLLRPEPDDGQEGDVRDLRRGCRARTSRRPR